MRKITVTCLLLFALVPLCYPEAAELHVPSEFSTIQSAIDAASEGDTVMVHPGRYSRIVFRNGTITVTSTGPDSREIVEGTVIDGGGDAHAVLFPQNGISRSIISGFTITGGAQTGIRCESSGFAEASNNPTIMGNLIIGNGRGIQSSYSAPIIINNTISDGGISLSSNYDKISVTGNIITNGSISIFNNFGEVILAGNTVLGNRWNGLLLWSPRALVSIVDNTILDHGESGIDADGDSIIVSGNRIYGNLGGGLRIEHANGAIITNNLVYLNTYAQESVWPASGIFVSYSRDFLVEGNTVTGNRGLKAGGIFLYEVKHFQVNGNLIWGNQSDDPWGSGPIEALARTGQFVGNMITGNRGAWAVSIVSESASEVRLSNNIVRSNSSNRLSLSAALGTVHVVYCNIQDGLSSVSGEVIFGPGNMDADPLFVDPGHWDGDTFVLGDYHLLPGSPCIDAGTNDIDHPYTTKIETFPDTDIAGLPRIIDGNLDGIATVDIGAYEHLPGDVNYDGRVNILDLITVRASLGQDPSSSPAARKADANADGRVNIEDLIMVRGRLGK